MNQSRLSLGESSVNLKPTKQIMLSHFSVFASDSLRTYWPSLVTSRPNETHWIAECRSAAGHLCACSDAELQQKASLLRVDGNSMEDHLTSFALALEAIRRVLRIELYDVQLQAGLALLRGSIAQVQTGEGKTLVAALAAIGHVLAGRTTHVMTVNSYLAERDYRLLAPIYQLLGLSVGWIDSSMSFAQKQQAYRCDVVYGPGYEFGFDYLRDRISDKPNANRKLGDRIRERLRGEEANASQILQGPLCAAIVDEADSVMLDEATTPLLISEGGQQPAANAHVYHEACRLANQLERDRDFKLSNDGLDWTQLGKTAISQPSSEIAHGLNRSWMIYVQQALRALHYLHRDVHYVVEHGQIQIVDQQTGRIFTERSWSEGLQQAVEAKEGLVVTAENQVIAKITRQRYLRLYPFLSGLTGTAEGSLHELKDIFGLDVAVIPTHRTSQRLVLAPQIFSDRNELEKAVVEEVRFRQRQGQPVLIGTTSIRSTERLADLLERSGIAYQSLTGRQDADEASVIAQAGQRGTITIATNMAGRGTDIHIDPDVRSLGGLHVMVTELNESARVERQLIGRAARQGDPGSSQVFISAEDPLLVRQAPELIKRIRQSLVAGDRNDSEVVDLVRRLQKELESQRTSERRQMFAHDDWLESVMNEIG